MNFKCVFMYKVINYLFSNPWNIRTLVENETTNGISLKIVIVLNSVIVSGGPSSAENVTYIRIKFKKVSKFFKMLSHSETEYVIANRLFLSQKNFPVDMVTHPIGVVRGD